MFVFKTVEAIEEEAKKEGWDYAHAVLTDDGKIELERGYEIKLYPQNEMYYCAESCKTQFAKKLVEHIWVAEIIRAVAGRCKRADVDDEGDYYHSGKSEDASEAIAENGKMIDGLVGTLAGIGWDKSQVITNETKIKPLRTATPDEAEQGDRDRQH